MKKDSDLKKKHAKVILIQREKTKSTGEDVNTPMREAHILLCEEGVSALTLHRVVKTVIALYEDDGVVVVGGGGAVRKAKTRMKKAMFATPNTPNRRHGARLMAKKIGMSRVCLFRKTAARTK